MFSVRDMHSRIVTSMIRLQSQSSCSEPILDWKLDLERSEKSNLGDSQSHHISENRYEYRKNHVDTFLPCTAIHESGGARPDARI